MSLFTGLATQTILTIPVNHVNSSDQMVNLALNNGQVVTTSLANLQAMAQPNLLSTPNNTSKLTIKSDYDQIYSNTNIVFFLITSSTDVEWNDRAEFTKYGSIITSVFEWFRTTITTNITANVKQSTHNNKSFVNKSIIDDGADTFTQFIYTANDVATTKKSASLRTNEYESLS